MDYIHPITKDNGFSITFYHKEGSLILKDSRLKLGQTKSPAVASDMSEDVGYCIIIGTIVLVTVVAILSGGRYSEEPAEKISETTAIERTVPLNSDPAKESTGLQQSSSPKLVDNVFEK